MKLVDIVDVKANIKKGLIKCVVKDGGIFLETDVGERVRIGDMPEERRTE